MSEQVNQQPNLSKRRLSKSKLKSSTTQVGHAATQPQRPVTENSEAWHAYWQTLNQHWRTEPEIDEARQVYLSERRRITPNDTLGKSDKKLWTTSLLMAPSLLRHSQSASSGVSTLLWKYLNRHFGCSLKPCLDDPPLTIWLFPQQSCRSKLIV